MSEGQSLLFSLIGWSNVLFRVAIVVVAFARLRATPAGLLIGGGYALLTVVAIVLRVLAGAGVNYVIMMAGEVVVWGLYALVGVGILLIPSSLKRLAQRG